MVTDADAPSATVATVSPWEFMRQRRAAMGLSQVGLSQALGLAQVTVSQWETGKNPPRWEYVRPLATALGVGPDALMSEVLDHWHPAKKNEHSVRLDC